MSLIDFMNAFSRNMCRQSIHFNNFFVHIIVCFFLFNWVFKMISKSLNLSFFLILEKLIREI